MIYLLDGHARLTIEHPSSSYGIPVLVDDRYEGPRGPDDLLKPHASMRGLDYVEAYFRLGDPLPDLVRAYLESARHPTQHTREILR